MNLNSLQKLTFPTNLYINLLVIFILLNPLRVLSQGTDWGGPRGALTPSDINSMIDERQNSLRGYRDRLNDPDPNRSLAALQAILKSDDAELKRHAIAVGLFSGSKELSRAAFMNLFQIESELVFEIGSLDNISPLDTGKIRSLYGENFTLTYDSVENGSLCFFPLETDEACQTEDQIHELEGDLGFISDNSKGMLTFVDNGLIGEVTNTHYDITFPISLKTPEEFRLDVEENKKFVLIYIKDGNDVISISDQVNLIAGRPITFNSPRSARLKFETTTGEPLPVHGIRVRSEPTPQQSRPNQIIITASSNRDNQTHIGRYDFPQNSTYLTVNIPERYITEVNIFILPVLSGKDIRIDGVDILTDTP